MIDLKGFRRINGLKQAEVAEYLGVSRAFISLVESGASKLPHDKLACLRANKNGWDTTALVDDIPTQSVNTHVTDSSNVKVNVANGTSSHELEVVRLTERVKSLETQLAEANARYESLLNRVLGK